MTSPRPSPKFCLAERTRTTYQEPLVIGRDLMSFVISDKVESFAPDGSPMQPLATADDRP